MRYFRQFKRTLLMSLQTLAAVDLGSNSFHLQIVRVLDETLYPLDSLKETVRLGAGVTPDKDIDAKTAERAFATLRLFADRLRGMPKNNVRVVGTNALRIAKNAREFIAEAEAILGFPIEIIAGREEARLIYLGVAKSLAPSNVDRLVVDIGGGSTELIIGHRLKPKQMDSLYMGCVSYSTRFFPDGNIDKKNFRDAQLAARTEIELIRAAFLKEGWREAYGSSGTAKALAGVLIENGFSENSITREGLAWLRDRALKAGNFRDLGLGIKADRIPVMAGGLAIMLTIFEELNISQMMPVDSALRDGVLNDMLGRTNQADMPDVREATIEQFAKRYHIDLKQAERVRGLAQHFFDGANKQRLIETDVPLASPQRLRWAATLHEIGMAIAQAGFHKHSAYILANADMPGFSKREQASLAKLVLAQRSKLGKVVADTPLSDEFMIEVMCLRLAVLLSRSRRTLATKFFTLAREDDKSVTLSIDATWLAEHDLTDYELSLEVAEWNSLSVNLALKKAI